MLTNVSIDYETYSEADLKKVGAWAYSEHPSTEVVWMGFAIGGDEPVLWKPGQQLPYFMQEDTHGEFMVNAWNSFFEYCITLNTLKIKPPPIQYWSDTMAKAAAMGLPGKLENTAEVLGLRGDKGKDKRGKKLIQLLSSPQKSTKKQIQDGWHPTYRNKDPELIKEFGEYCLQDVKVEIAINKKLFDLIPVERELWELDQEINLRGVQLDIENIDNCINIYEKQSKVTLKELQELTGLENPNSHTQFLPWLKKHGYTEDNVQAETLKEFLKKIESE